MLKDLKKLFEIDVNKCDTDIHWISAEYSCNIDFAKEDIVDALAEHQKDIDDVEDAYIKYSTLYVQFKWDNDYTELLDNSGTETGEFKRPESTYIY